MESFSKGLEKWFSKWHRKKVTGRCLIELKNRDKKFVKEILEEIQYNIRFARDLDYHRLWDFIEQKTGYKK